ncbi:MAG TPA: pyridoxal-dependent decarboxylase [Solirubrobacteraceae bacterium]|jgi:glutamate/tyrosine decarboxylase-like PLP-dependent enzyme
MEGADHDDAARRVAIARRLGELGDFLQARAAAGEVPRAGASRPYGKYPAREFDYLAELDALEDFIEPQPDRVADEVAAFFRGAQRPESKLCLFNLNALPTVDATAAACLSLIANVNGLMDAFAGEALLAEQKVARTIGRWAGWPQAMGISCGGGKATMIYALRCAIARADPDAARNGISRPMVVLCSAGAHYSVEHVASIAGLGSGQVRRVALDRRGAMRADSLRDVLDDAHADGALVAAIMCSGGTVIDFCCDDLVEVHRIAREHSARHDVTMPYLHFDSVIGWLYLSLRGLPESLVEGMLGSGAGRERADEVLARAAGLEHFDSLGVDLHKTGMCPYASSFFVGRDRGFMDALGDGSYAYGDVDFRSGSFRTYRFTLENTRSTQGTLAAWVNLVGLGRRGLGAYLADLHEGRDGLEAALHRHGRFAALNTSSLGWEVVFDIPQPSSIGASYREFAISFMEHCWARVARGEGLPLFSIVPEYQIDHQPELSRVAFVLYPMGSRASQEWDWVVRSISEALDEFASEGATRASRTGWERPIR